MPSEPAAPWRQRVRRAVADRSLRSKVEANTTRVVRAKAAAYAALDDAQGLRERAAAIKRQALARLPELLVQLERQVAARGGEVHHAADAAAVGRIVLEIARRHGARLAVKSKSMVSEEVGLNHLLAAAGVEALETDLGEHIIQLAGETPSHLIMPVIHKSTEDCAAALGLPGERDPAALAAHARRMLREKFLAADIGITGGNFLLAESGTLVLVTNEGNGRMVTSLPRVHIALVGVEKVIPGLAELPPLLALLPRAGTGQRVTAYVSLLSGPRGPGEADGPEEFHLVLVDNGRLAVREGPYVDALACIRCGACLNVCPVYRQVGGQAYGSPYAGPIGVVVTSLLEGLGQRPELPDFCSLCAACDEACPVEIPLHEQIRRLRADRARGGYDGEGHRLFYRLWAWAWSDPRRYRRFARLARRGQGLAAPRLLDRWAAGRDLPPLAAESFHERWARRR